MITDTCPCYYPGNFASNKRWCGGGWRPGRSLGRPQSARISMRDLLPEIEPFDGPFSMGFGYEGTLEVGGLGGLLTPTPPSPPRCCGDMYHLDLSVWAFEKLAQVKWGVIAVSWRDVPCWYKPKNAAKLPWVSAGGRAGGRGFEAPRRGLAVLRSCVRPNWSPFMSTTHPSSPLAPASILQWAKPTPTPYWYKAPWGFNKWMDKRLPMLKSSRNMRAYPINSWGRK